MWAATFLVTFAFIVLLFTVYMQIRGGKQYAPGAKRRRKLLLPFFFGRRSIFKRIKRLIAPAPVHQQPEVHSMQH